MKLLVAILFAGLLGLVGGVWTWARPGDPALYPARAGDPGVVIQVLDNGFHTDLVLPRARLESGDGPLAQAARSIAPGDWVVIGWGDAKFYVDQSPMADRLPDGARAFFHPNNASVVMLDPVSSDPASLFASDGRRPLRLSSAGFEALRRHIEASLDLRTGGPRMAAARPGDDARFFASHESFWIGYLCNHWAARQLNAGGLAIRPMRAATSAEVMRTVRASAQLDSRGASD